MTSDTVSGSWGDVISLETARYVLKIVVKTDGTTDKLSAWPRTGKTARVTRTARKQIFLCVEGIKTKVKLWHGYLEKKSTFSKLKVKERAARDEWGLEKATSYRNCNSTASTNRTKDAEEEILT